MNIRTNKPLNSQLATLNSPRGFTLIELLLVLVILGILAAIVVPKFAGRTDDARNAAAKTQIAGFSTSLDAYEVDTGSYPKGSEGLFDLVQAPSDVQGWKGPYMKEVPVDPWGKPYVYLNPGIKAEIDVMSFGADGQSGGEGKNADIGSWQP
jgi:general secretion pathway protein G